jgi:uncharacterized protein (TIGR03435 family)
MIAKYFPAMWATIAPVLGNHLWQSTLFAITAGLLTLILRKNHARFRYWLWLAASVKFLIPFSLLVGLGSHLAWGRGHVGTKAGLYFAMEQLSQPFSQPAIPVISRATPSTVSPRLLHPLPALLAAAWLCGFAAVLFVWYAHWWRISAAIREGVPLREGREVEALRRVERLGGIRTPTEMFLSRDSLEPGIFGIARPVLVWPEGISERLYDAHMEAILAHELWHIRRRDNLAAAIHMVVEAIFWFHPLVWWLGVRLVEERERACDEEVLELGSDRHVYAESILKTCEFCVESPLACVAGVTGADLKKRIDRIMTEGVARKLDFSRKLLLSVAGLVAGALPILSGLLHATQSQAQSQALNTAGAPLFEVASIRPNKTESPMARMTNRPDAVQTAIGLLNSTQTSAESQAQNTASAPVFEVSSIKENNSGDPIVGILSTPDSFTATNYTLQRLIRLAYGVQDSQIFGGPNWLNSEKYDIEAKMDSSVADELRKLSFDEHKVVVDGMLQALLAERFGLTLHHETVQVPVYALVIAENGLKLQRAIPGDTYPNGFKRSDDVPIGAGDWSQPGKFVGQGVPIASLLQVLSEHYLHRTVLDKTALTDKYDFTLQWAPVESQAAIFTAIQEQLGLKLESQKGPLEILVIDHAEKPSEN